MARDRFNFPYFFKFFLTISFPTHFWTLLMVFRDLEFVSERTDLGGTIGYAGYSLLGALAESLIISIIFWGISLVITKKLSKATIFAILVSFYYVLAGASIIDMAAHVFDSLRLSQQYLYGLSKYPEITYGLIAAVILIGLITCLALILRSAKFSKIIQEIFDRIILLSYLYLFLDLIGIGVIIWRNLG